MPAISFLDNSILTLNKDSKSYCEKILIILSLNPKFIILFKQRKALLLSLERLLKIRNGIMRIDLSEMEVGLSGTLITGSNTDQG